MAKVELVLVGAKRFTLVSLGTSPMVQGQKISVDPEVAEYLQSQFNVDAANGRREIFVPPNHPRALQYAKNQEADAKASTPTRSRRRTAART